MSYNTRLQTVSADLQTLINKANNLPEPTTLPELTNPGTASDLLSGKELIDADGNVVTGTIATKTASDLTASGATVTVPAGYYASQTTKSVATATQVTPSVTVSSSGLITASATQTAGYVTAGTKSVTKQLTTQSAKTITPSTSSQTAVASGVYTTGAVTVAAIPSTYVEPTATKTATTYTPTTSNQTIAAGTYCSGAQTIQGDSNLIADNIKSGVSIFGVSGSYEGSGSGSGSGATIETCTVYLYAEEPTTDTVTVYYTGVGPTPLSESMSAMSFMRDGFTLTVVKGTVLTISISSDTWMSTGDATLMTSSSGSVFAINGDCELAYV